MVTSDYHVWFIEANNTPLWPNSYNMAVRIIHLVVHYMTWCYCRVTSVLDLVIEIYSSPDKFVDLQPGEKYGSWELVYNELLANCSGYQYNPCRDFPIQS